ncbi:beta-lactamase/transpeptidase-like protein [Calycina marina]|uniref:Beta-lactamase/transpeptidase-like protein n=1 Tax=Calycina marina TaxID=1763456 RepID=A0A9P7YVB0_9HELO|nr:beta-lactamase/transpeptidase-like protein [Calycina marina]
MILQQVLLSSLLFPIASALGACYHPGPAFPPIDHILNKTQISRLAPKLNEVVQKVLRNPEDWTTNLTSFAVLVTSGEDTVWDYYHTAPILGDYTDSKATNVTENTAFRIASCSKSFTVYAILIENRINLEDPVTKYIPELLEGRDEDFIFGKSLQVAWDQITIRALASQLAGISRHGGMSDLAVSADEVPDPIAMGFPPVDDAALAPCMKNSKDRGCSSEEVVELARDQTLIFAPNDQSTYSNAAFSILGIVLERVTGKTYDQVLRSSILGPLDMKHTYTTKPKDSKGVIPYGPNDWAQNLKADTPSGGIYTSVGDLGKYLRSILISKLIPQAKRNAWYKPHSYGPGAKGSGYGMPWEMFRTSKVTPDGRAIDVITKGGALTAYYSTIVLLPEFGLAFTALVAGNPSALMDVREKVLAALVPAAEQLIREEMRIVFAGLWASASHWNGDPILNWSLKIEVDEAGPGLIVKDWISNGTDFMKIYGKLHGMPEDNSKWSARLLPTRIYPEFTGPLRGEPYQNSAWRLAAVEKQDPDKADRVFEDYCFADVDGLIYSGLSIEEFFILKLPREPTGHMEAAWAKNSGLRTVWRRVEDGEGRRLKFHGEEDHYERYGMAQMPMFG